MARTPADGPSHPPTTRLSAAQLAYILVLQGLGALVLGGGINFGIATAMYRHSGHLVWLWKVNENTLAGDAAVTIFVQIIVTWLISAAMVCNDVRTKVFGLRPLQPSQKALDNRFLGWYISVEGMDLLEPHITMRRRLQRVIEGVIKALFLCVPVFLIWWPIAVAIMAGVGRSIGGGNYEYNHWPEPQLFKLIFGGTLGLLVTPVIALLALAAKGRQYNDFLSAQARQQEHVAKDNRTLTTVV